MKTAPTFVQLIFCSGLLSLAHCLCHFVFWRVVVVTNLLSPPFIFWTFLFLHKLFHAFRLVLEFSVSFSYQNTFCCHWHLAAVISMDYFVSVWFGWLPKALNVTQANGAIEHLKYKFFWSVSQLHYRGLLPFMFYLFSEWHFLQVEKGF